MIFSKILNNKSNFDSRIYTFDGSDTYQKSDNLYDFTKMILLWVITDCLQYLIKIRKIKFSTSWLDRTGAHSRLWSLLNFSSNKIPSEIKTELLIFTIEDFLKYWPIGVPIPKNVKNWSAGKDVICASKTSSNSAPPRRVFSMSFKTIEFFLIDDRSLFY